MFVASTSTLLIKSADLYIFDYSIQLFTGFMIGWDLHSVPLTRIELSQRWTHCSPMALKTSRSVDLTAMPTCPVGYYRWACTHLWYCRQHDKFLTSALKLSQTENLLSSECIWTLRPACYPLRFFSFFGYTCPFLLDARSCDLCSPYLTTTKQET